MILNQPSATVIQQLWEQWFSCNKGGSKCHSSAGTESGTWVKIKLQSYSSLLLSYSAQKKEEQSRQPPRQILRLLGHLCGHTRTSYSHFRFAVIAKQAVVATQIIFLQARIVKCALCRSALMLWVFLSLQTPHQLWKKLKKSFNLWQLNKGMTEETLLLCVFHQAISVSDMPWIADLGPGCITQRHVSVYPTWEHNL